MHPHREKMRETSSEFTGFLGFVSRLAEALAGPGSGILDACVDVWETICQRFRILAVGSERPGFESQPCHFLALDCVQILSPPVAVSDDGGANPPGRVAGG